MRKFLIPLLFLPVFSIQAQTPYLVKDINTTISNRTASSQPEQFTAFGNRVYFVATTEATGTELWSTDGTSAGTSIVADLIPGSGSSNPSGLVVVNGKLLFSARDVDHGIELWTTDGTAAGTHMLIDLNPGPSSSNPGLMLGFKNGVLFAADDGTAGREIWFTDGTASGTHIVKDVVPGAGSSSPNAMFTFNGNIYFYAGLALWKTDGTDAGTVKVIDIRAAGFAVAGSQIFFAALTADAGTELWVSDGTAARTHIVADILPGSQGSLANVYPTIIPFGNRVLFTADDGVHGRELWISDGTAAGTHMLRDIGEGAAGLPDDTARFFGVFGDRAYFSANDAAHGTELWVTDGTEAGTKLYADLIPGEESSFVSFMIVSGGKLFITATAVHTTKDYAVGLWVIDSNGAPPRLVGAVRKPEPSGYLWPVNGKLYFAGRTVLTGTEPWVTDGTDAGTRQIANLAPDVTPSSEPTGLIAAGNTLSFLTRYDDSGTLSYEYSRWRTDGTAAGTYKLLADTGQHPDDGTSAGPYLFFKDDFTSGKWMITDGTVEGTKLADDFFRRFGAGARVEKLFPFGDTLYASVYDSYYDRTLWKTGFALDAPAVQLGSTNPYPPVDVGGHLFFYGTTPGGVHERGLWTTDGTPEGTYASIPDLNADYDEIGDLVNAEGTLFFFKFTGNNPALWKSDGTIDGTVKVKELPSALSFNREMKAVGRRVFLVADDNSLWVSDGTDAGTIQLAKLKLPIATHDNLIVVGNRVVFDQFDYDTNFHELWSSDGTVAGTKLLQTLGKNANPSPASIDGLVYFAGIDDQHGSELWVTDGTPEGTRLIADINPGPLGSRPASFTKAGNLLYFTAYTESTGDELWALPLTETLLSIGDGRANEGHIAHFTVTLSQPAKQAVTVDYATEDGSATAGADYDASTGTLTFAPGEITKSISVQLHDDTASENNETFFVRLRNASGARIVKPEGAGVIDDDDHAADVSIVARLIPAELSNSEGITVTNNGPNAATDIVVKVTATPPYGRTGCTVCSINQLLKGESAPTAFDYWPPGAQTFITATVTARQNDPQLSNNAFAWTLNSRRTLAMNAAYLTPGASATVSAQSFSATPVVKSSDPSVITAPSTITGSNGMGTFTVTALKPGTATISVDDRTDQALTITVVPAGTTPRWPGGVTLSTNFTATRFDQPLTLAINPSGTAPFTGATPTGIVTVTSGGKELLRRNITGTSRINAPFYLPALGDNAFVINYSGDANFLPQTSNGTVFVRKGSATLNAGLQPLSTPGTYALTVRATGSPLAPPTGAIGVIYQGLELTRQSLVAGAADSIVQTTLDNVPLGATLTITYYGDNFYDFGSQQVRTIAPRQRGIRH